MTDRRDCRRRRVLVFARAPEAGKVKTRLARRIGADGALALYRCFAEDLLDTLGALALDVTVFYTPRKAGGSVRRWLGPRYALEAQRGGDLGERMADAFRRTFQGGVDEAILVGTDLPDLPGAFIQEAFDTLARNGAAIGPALDGGYYLIGFTAAAFSPDFFQRMAWGRDDVFRRTLDRFGERALAAHVLPPWRDIDELGDLDIFIRERRRDAPAGGRTARYLKTIGWE